MTTAIGLSALGMINDMRQLDIISNNLANANTPGFKRDMAVTRGFDQLLSKESAPLASLLQVGQSQMEPTVERAVDFSPGALHYTGNPLDMAIEGDAYFELQGRQGVRYSRQGSFSIDAGGRLSHGNGLVVSGEEGEILLHGGEITLERDGRLYEDGDYAGQLKLVRFASPSALIKSGGGTMSAPSGQMAQPASDVGVRQGYQESSNVGVMEEMVRMISTMRHFETASRVIKGYDEMVGTAISTIAEF